MTDRSPSCRILPPRHCTPFSYGTTKPTIVVLQDLPNWKMIRDFQKKEGLLAKNDVIKIISLAFSILKHEPNALTVKDPVTIVGDIHGQYYDLIKLLTVGGEPEKTKYLFLGDFVDRGSFSMEVIILVLALKINFPKTVFLLRGNHECRQMTQSFNFRQEVLYKYDAEIYDLLIDLFDSLPLAAIINGKFLAVHGGISPELTTISDLQKINRFKEPPKAGLIW